MFDRAAEHSAVTRRLSLTLLVLLFSPCAAGADSPEAAVHPACFEPYLAAGGVTPNPWPLRIDECNQRHADQPVTRMSDQTRYERPQGPAGELRGTLAYEQLSGPGEQVVYRLFDHAGGTGVFSYLLTARVRASSSGVLRDIRVYPLGDRCDLGSAWIGQDANDRPVTAIALTPASLPAVLAAPPDALPMPERDRTRADLAFGTQVRTRLSNCPTCCIGEAVYRLSNAGSWTLLDVTLDTLAPFDRAATPALSKTLRAGARKIDGGVRVEASHIDDLQLALVSGHPAPASTRRTQFWLQRLGYYWTAPVDGIAGPRTEDAARAFTAEHVTAIERHGFASALALSGIAYAGRRLHPVDETDLDADFARFRARLDQAVAARNAETLVALSAPDILLGFGGTGGLADLRRLLAHKATQRALWQDLDSITALGAVRVGPNTYCMPYSACVPEETGHFGPLAGLDPLHSVIVVTPDARFWRTAESGSSEIRRLDHDIMTRLPDVASIPDAMWRVRDNRGRVGYVDSADARMPAGPRIELQRDDDGWRIVSLVSGD